MARIEQEHEYLLNTSSKILFNCISTPGGLSEWFCDDVNISKDGMYTFFWDGSQEIATLVNKKNFESIRFRWEDDEPEYYFEFSIRIDPMTKQVALIITDFSEEDELDESKLLWDSQVASLKSIVGG
ncbi:MAG: START-like domain-containing protein [Flavobacteriales bacterium]|jgi:hypothetical protein|nr:START-like domain-containing protein [Flavobacteriales bacterium]